MKNILLTAAAAIFIMAKCDHAAAQSNQHVAQVIDAQRSAYVISGSTNACPYSSKNIMGWPKEKILDCEYKKDNLTGAVFLLEIKPETTALWIENTCNKFMPNENRCFGVVLRCGRLNSGMMFPISGNIIEGGLNYYFRNGMTVRMKGFPHGKNKQINLALQRKSENKPNSSITMIKSGLTRFWRTRPAHMRALTGNQNIPEKMDSDAKRATWLTIVQYEMLRAISNTENRLLDAYVSTHAASLSSLLPRNVTDIHYADCPR